MDFVVSAKRPIHLDSWEGAVEGLHRSIAGESSISWRLRKIAEAFLGRPYVSGSLGGGPGQTERLAVELGGFDCITFIEVTLAVARSHSKAEFIAELKRTRYRDGLVDWSSRLHYFSDWMRYNERRGAVKIRTRGSGSRSIKMTLGSVEGLPNRQVRFQVVPKHDVGHALPRISDGSIVGFASVRSRLDFFHTGLLFYQPGQERSVKGLMLYQAIQSAGEVIAEPLSAFLKRNRMRGIAFAAPVGTGE